MKVPKINIAFFVAGTIAFSYLLYHFGVHQIFEYVQRTGISLLYAILVWLVIYVLNTIAWRLVLGEIGSQISSGRLFMVTVSGFSINTITPLVTVGGEPYRVKMLAQSIGMPRSISAVLLYRIVSFIGHMVSILVGIAIGFPLAALPLSLRIFLAGMFAGIFVIVSWVFSMSRRGMFERITDWTQRHAKLERLSTVLQERRLELRKMDAMLRDAHRGRQGRFSIAVALEFVSRILMALEICILLHGVGIDISITDSVFVYALYSILINLFFFVPLNFGTLEGGMMLALQSLGLTPFFGVYLGVVTRLRDFFWIAVGLLMVLFTGQRKLPVSD